MIETRDRLGLRHSAFSLPAAKESREETKAAMADLLAAVMLHQRFTQYKQYFYPLSPTWGVK